MICPKCANKGFEPTEDVKYPLVNLGGKERYDTVDIRRYGCTQCNYRFKTQEVFFTDMIVPVDPTQKQSDLKFQFEDG